MEPSQVREQQTVAPKGVLLATSPPSAMHRRVALGVGLAAALVFIVLLPEVRRMLPAVPGFIPVYESAVIINDLVTAVLLFGQFHILRTLPLLVLASAYVGTALLAAVHGLTFPGLFAPTGLLGATTQSTAWIYMFWHAGFPACAMAYALCRPATTVRHPARATALTLGLVTAGVLGLTLLATSGSDLLATIMQGNEHAPPYDGVAATTLALSMLALVAQWRWHRRSVLDLWLLVVLFAWTLEFALSALFQHARFDLGFYAGRAFGWLASFLVLSILLLENGQLYARLVDTVDEERRAKAALQGREQELTLAHDAAEQANRAKSAFLATISHEIRTPMNGVVGLIDVLTHTRLNDHQRDLVRTIRESATTLLTLIDDILDFSKIEAGRLEIEHAPVAVADLVESLCNSLVPVANRRGVELSLFVSPRVPTCILSDDVRLRQLIYNLMGNAIKFSAGRPEQRGQVTLRVGISAEPGLAPQLVCRISDNGIGIPAEILPMLFQPFTQAEVATTRLYGGTGLGLTICQRLVDLMEGRIDVASVPGQGSVFTVSLPLQCAEQETAAPAPSPAAPPGRPELHELPCAVVAGPDLVAEDVAAYLAHGGAQVAVVHDLDEAAAWARAHPLAIILQGVPRNGNPATFLTAALDNLPGVRHVLIARGYAHNIQTRGGNVVTLNGDILRRQSLLQAVAVAAGRASPIAAPGADPDAHQKPLRAPSVTEARVRGQLILVAEDDAINQKVILQQLALLGHAAEVAHHGAEALDMWRRGQYALLLSDLHMPGMDGYELAERIRDEEQGRTRMPILALTANALRGEARRVRASGFDDYLTKPVQLRVLKGALEKWMPRATAEPAMSAPSDPLARDADAAVPMVDLVVLRDLVGSEPEVLADFLHDYLHSLQSLRDEMSQAVAQSDAERVESIAHRLKSSCRSVGALTLGDLCAHLESAGKTDDMLAIRQLLHQFLDTARHVEQFIIAELETGTFSLSAPS
ncbi:MAG: MASE4 domain-containing protein [Burkholderiaceae bacterium]|nr:MASE4 domain-containing protein [Burkholderiaceae bacterium]